MELDTNSILQFTPDHSRTWVARAELYGSVWYLPVMGWAVVVGWHGDSEESGRGATSDSQLQPVVFGFDYQAQTKHDFEWSHGADKQFVGLELRVCTPEEWLDAYQKWIDS